MDVVGVERRRAEIVRRWGEWTAHNIHLGDGVYTLGPDREADKLRRVVQIVSDLGPGPIERLRVLDLGCLEGGYAVELARRGAEVVAIEAREANLEKARFAKEVLGLAKLELVQDDVRNVSEARYGRFDVILCLGILYHLDSPHVFSFVHRIAEVCRRLAVFDTYVGLSRIQRFEHGGHEYWGRVIREHTERSTEEERIASKWASLDNTTSLWITRSSLYNLLNDVGFSSAYECHLPTELDKPADRLTVIAVKGRAETLLAMPRANDQPMGRLPENDRRPTSRKQQLWPEIQERATNAVPLSWRKSIKAGLRRVRMLA
jgi:2-polyprenyl-3-methyl-5-hydroxy-6-metoxy-1,4-benzoquinol methylase